MNKVIKWDEGDGSIAVAYDGNGNGSAFVSSDINEGLDREQEITVKTTEGASPKQVAVMIRQVGMREVFVCADGGFLLADGETYNVLKNEL